MADPLLPDDPGRVGPYELVGRLGDGGQGSVYLGRDGQGRTVAVKLLHARLSGDPAARSRFVRELEVAERVSGFCTARVLDADVQGGRPYIVSEYVPGPSLTALVRDEGPLDGGALLRLAIGTATALAAIHRAGIVHRDFKPPNVLIAPGGPRVIDFGIARALDSSGLTLTSQVVGTPAYMAPEQVAGGEVGPAADVFAWAATMVFAASGRAPFGGDSIPAVMHRVLHAEPDVTALPGALRELVRACLAKDPRRRPSSPDVLRRLLQMAGAQEADSPVDLLERGATLVTTVLDDVALQAPPPPRRRLVTAATAVLLAAVGIVVSIVWVSGKPRPVKIGVIAPLSGVEGTFGSIRVSNVALAVQEYNAADPSVPVTLVQYDSYGSAEGATAAANRAVAEGVAAVIGPYSESEVQRVAPILELAKIPSVAAVSGRTFTDQGWAYWHTMVPDDAQAVLGLADLVIRRYRSGQKIVLLDDGRPDSHAAEFMARVNAKSVPVERLDLTARVVDELKRREPDVIVYGGPYATAGPLIKRARQAKVGGRFHLTGAVLTDALGKLAGSDTVEGTLMTCSCFGLPKLPYATVPATYEAFFQRYEKAGNGRISGGADPGWYDATWSVLHALTRGNRIGPDIDAFLRQVNEPGTVQQIRFTAKGELAGTTIFVYQYKDGWPSFVGDARSALIQ